MRRIFILALIGIATQVSFAQVKDSVCKTHYGIAYPISTHGKDASNITNKFSLHLLTANSAGVDGFEATGVLSNVKGNVEGMQLAGIANITEGNVKGIQGTWGLNFTKGNVKGLQCSGVMNIAEKNVKGFQGAGCANIADSIKGFQGSGFINIANEVKGVQWSSFINYAKNVKGTQISGFINIADSSDYPVGLVNIIKNGKKTLNVSTNMQNDIMLSFKSGGRKLFGIVGLGYNPFYKELEFSAHVGMGYHIPVTQKFTIDIEGIALGYLSKDDMDEADHKHNHHKNDSLGAASAMLNIVFDYQPFKHFGITAGPTLQYMFTKNKSKYDCIDNTLWHKENLDKNRFQSLWAGFTAGVYYRF